MIKKLKLLFTLIRNLLVWFCPFFLFLISIFIAWYFIRGSFDMYLQLAKVLIWPVVALIGMFFFRKVVTYMFFSMDGFKFFGAEGTLKNVNDLIDEEVHKKFLEKEREKLSKEITAKNTEIDTVVGDAKRNKALAKEILGLWRASTEKNNKTIGDLENENNKLRELVLNNSTSKQNLTLTTEPEKGSGEKVENVTLGEPQQNK
jgi:energy-coupling factor transporter transmembrane protein EcfT